MDKEKLIREIDLNFKDMKEALIDNCMYDLVPLIRDYTGEIIKIIERIDD